MTDEKQWSLAGIYWECKNGHRFAHGSITNPGTCPDCGSTYIKWMLPEQS